MRHSLAFIALSFILFSCQKEQQFGQEPLQSYSYNNSESELSFVQKMNYVKHNWKWNDKWADSLKGKKTVLFGNSIAFNITWPDFDETYTNKGHNLIARGIGGSTFCNWKPNYVDSLVTRNHPDQILFYFGENEFDSAYRKNPTNKYVAYHLMDDMANLYWEVRRQNPNATITPISMMASPRMFTYGYEQSWDIDYFNKLWQRLVAADVAKGNKATYIELKSALQLFNPRRPYYSMFHPDEVDSMKLHLGRPGYKVWASKIIPALVK